VNRQDLQALAEERLDDARALLANGRYGAAYYLCGYVVECGLKACIARQIRAEEFPPYSNFSKDVFTHEVKALIKLANLENALQQEIAVDIAFKANWGEVSKWSEGRRYDSAVQFEAQQLFDAIADPGHGVLQWLRRHW
jgi:HEPN domain-containing protein